MSRRVVLLIALSCLALLATAVAPWTLSSGGLAAAVGQQLREAYGLELAVRGRSTIAFLPVPRVKFEDITLTAPGAGAVARGGTLRGELRVASLLLGRAELSEVALSGSRIELGGDTWGVAGWNRLMALLRQQTNPKTAVGPHIRRLLLTGVAVERSATDASDDTLQDLHLFVKWPSVDAAAEIVGSLVWRGERIEIARANVRPAALASRQAAPFVLALDAPIGRVSLSGEVQSGDEPQAHGQSLIELRSPRDLSRWTGVEVPLGPLMQAVSIDGEFTADRRMLAWPSVRLTLGADRLDGTLSIRFDGDRPLIAGTLAANELNLSDFFAPFLQARTASGLWSSENLAVPGVTGGDLDLRLSATAARIGHLRLDEMAAGVLVRLGRIEATLGRATLNRGVVKGRLSLAAAVDGTDLKGQGSFERVDIGALLTDLGQPRWITGQTQGQVTFEGIGATPDDLVRQIRGRAVLGVRHGELIGIGLNDVLRRVEKRPLAASLEWKGGRTPFEQAQVQLAFEGGIGEILDGTLTAPAMRMALQGRVSLVDRTLAVKAHVDAASPAPGGGPTFMFDVTGGWDDIAIIPDAKALIQRSGAAQPLFGPPPSAASRGASALPPSSSP